MSDKVEERVEQESGKSEAKATNIFRIISFGTYFDFFLIGMCCLTAIGAGTAMPLMFIIFGRLVNNFADYFVPGTTTTQAEFQRSVNQNSLYFVYLFISKWALGYISLLCIRISGMRISSSLRLAYIRALFAQPISMVDKVSPGKVSSRITTSANTIQLGISQQFSLCIQAITFLIGAYVVAFIKSPLLTLVASSCIPFVILTYGITIPFFIKIHKKTEELLEEGSSLSFEIFSSIRIVVAFGAEQHLHAHYASTIDRACQNEKKCGPLMGMMMSPMFFAAYATMALAFWFGIRQYIRHDVSSVGSIAVVLFSVLMAVSQIGRVSSPIIAMAKAATVSAQLLDTIDTEIVDTSGLKGSDVQTEADIVFDNVSFSYLSRPNVQVLRDLTLTFEAGKVTAIVGPSGSGKSTIVGLIERWYEIDESHSGQASKRDGDGNIHLNAEKDEISASNDKGTIMIGDKNIKDIDAKWWRSQIGLVQQEPFVFNDTIYNNVAYGLCGTDWQDITDSEKLEMVKSACREAYADEFISRLPMGYNTIVGESGIKLSGGQRQHLAIARSIVKQPSILILDEATSSIDVRAEHMVQAALDRMAQNRTTIVIAHRLSTIKKADKIIVLRQGEVAEEGTHEKLMTDRTGLYHGLVNTQALIMDQDELHNADAPGMELSTIPQQESDRIADPDIVLPFVPVVDVGNQDTHKYKRKSFFTSFGRLIYEQRTHWCLYSMIIIGALGAGVVYPLQAYIFAKLISAFTLTGLDLVNAGNYWSLMFFIQALGVGIAYFLLGRASLLAALAISAYYRKEYLRHILDQKIAFFDAEGNSAGTLTSRLSDDPHRVEALIGTETSMGLIAVVNLLGCIIISFIYGWKLSLVGNLTLMPVILTAGFYRIKLEREFEELNAAVFEESSQFATEAIGAFRTVTSLVMEDVVVNRYATLLRTHVVRASQKALSSTIVFATSDSIELLCQALVFWYGGRLMASHEYNTIKFFVVYMAVIHGSQAAGMWFSFSPNIAEAAAASNRIISLRPPTAIVGTPTSPAFHTKAEGMGIEFRDVHFTYKGRSIPALKGLNLKIQPGQFAALVGASGSGKSTIVSLLERFYDPDSGTIFCGGQDITSGSMKTYRSHLSLVTQESTLYQGTIKENVSLSVGYAHATDEAIEEACKEAQIHDFIISLPDGYATKVGPKAVQLSGGQRQRLALARAFLRKSKILLLDEATSSIDSEAEKLVQEAIERVAGDGQQTVVAVAHRLATIQNAAIIFVISSGRVLEEGNHQELLKRKGLYYQMCQEQAL